MTIERESGDFTALRPRTPRYCREGRGLVESLRLIICFKEPRRLIGRDGGGQRYAAFVWPIDLG